MSLNVLVRHKHHIIPKHAGGGDDALNITPPISVRMHAMFHYDRWRALGQIGDYVSWRFLLGKIGTEEVRRLTSITARKEALAEMTPEMRKQRWGRHRGSKVSEITREKMRRAKIGLVRCPLSDETKTRISTSKLGTKASEETKEKMRNAHLGKKQPGKRWSTEARERFTGRKCPWVGEANRKRIL